MNWVKSILNQISLKIENFNELLRSGVECFIQNVWNFFKVISYPRD